MTIEVFKTNVLHPHQATRVMDQISSRFSGYTANFDLADCDKILRVSSDAGPVHVSSLIGLLNNLGFYAEVLSDDLPIRVAGNLNE